MAKSQRIKTGTIEVHGLAGQPREVVLIFGPPAAGKTTLAHTLGLEVYDRDDPKWNNDDAAFRQAMRDVGADPGARAVVIRTGVSRLARRRALLQCKPTRTVVLDTPPEVCLQRLAERGGDTTVQAAAVERWWRLRRQTMEVSGG